MAAYAQGIKITNTNTKHLITRKMDVKNVCTGLFMCFEYPQQTLLFVSYLMDDLRYWQLVHIRVPLLLQLSIHRTERQITHKTELISIYLNQVNCTLETLSFCQVGRSHSVMKRSCREEEKTPVFLLAVSV